MYVSKNIHDYLKRLLKYASLSQLQICGSQDFLHILKNTHRAKLNARGNTTIQRSYVSTTKNTQVHSYICFGKYSLFFIKIY